MKQSVSQGPSARISVADRQRRAPVDVRFHRRLLRNLLSLTRRSPAVIGLTFVNDQQMRRINHDHRRIDRPTDVLAFPVSAWHRKRDAHVRGRSASSPPANPHRNTGLMINTPRHERIHVLGDIVISIETARRQAREAGATLREECRRLLIHGYLHLLGYDHERSRPEAVRMRRMERRLEARVSGMGRRAQ